MHRRLLLINDDGLSSPGLLTFVSELVRSGQYEIAVVAPAEEQSGVGFHLTLHTPLYAKKIALPGEAANVPAFMVWGTPVDCVKLALRGLLGDYRPDLVLSGINKGENIARLVPYSGTVSAALEASLNGIPAAAFSLEHSADGVWNFLLAAEISAWVVKNLPPLSAKEGIINVNIPNRPSSALAGIKLTRQGRSFFDEYYVPEEVDGEGRRRFRLEGKFAHIDDSDEIDVCALRNGWVTVTPLGSSYERSSENARSLEASVFAEKFPFARA